MRFGYFALALTLAASALTAEAWSPPYQTHRLYYSNQYGLRSPTSMSLDNSDAFTIRITGLQMDWNFRDYGNVFRMVHEQVAGEAYKYLLISATGEVYGNDRNKFTARLTEGNGAVGDWSLPDWSLSETRGLDLVVAFNGTSGKITAYVDGEEYFVTPPQGPTVDANGDGPYALGNIVSSDGSAGGDKFFTGYGLIRPGESTPYASYEMNGYQESITVWADVALDATVVREAHEGFYANVPTPNHHYSFCEGAAFTSDVGVLSGYQSDVVIRDHITGDSAHDLLWNEEFEKFRDAPAEGAAFAGAAGECCEPMYRQFGFTTRAANGTFRGTVDGVSAESVDEGRRCHA